MNRILKINPAINIEYARKVIGIRNKIIHGYDEIDDIVIYVVAIKHLKKLKEDISKL